ncbi:exostosin-2, partial [Dactylonectria estremocensis]
IALLAYKRPVMLDETLHFLTREHVPSLHEILVIWNDQDSPLPEDYVAAHGVTVRFKATPRNSMTMKYIPYPEYRTKAVLLHDDDVHYELADMEFAFQTWRNRGQYQITGAFARCMDLDKAGDLPTYGCVDASYYNMVLTGLLFTHIAFLDYFSSSDPLATRLREYVDDAFDCDDIAFNYVAQMLSCVGPYQVTGPMRAFDAHPASGSISGNPEHVAMRWQCARDFAGLFGYMPLKRTTEHLVRGAMGWR